MKYFLIMNPGSRDGKSAKTFDEIKGRLQERRVDFTCDFTKSLDHAYAISARANAGGYDVIVAVGGDGTINKVLNGFFDADGRRISRAKFGIIYTGTSPDICKENDIPFHDIAASVETLIKGHVKQVEVGAMQLHADFSPKFDGKPFNGEGNTVSRYFLCAANIGVGAQVARYAGSGVRKYLGDVGGTFFSLIRTIATFRAHDYTVRLDGLEQRVPKVFNMCIGKSYNIASGMTVKHELKPGDRLFYNVTIKNFKHRNIGAIVSAVYSGQQIENNDAFSFSYHKEVEIYGNNGSPEVESDGDPVGFLPCRITTASDTIDLIVRGG